MRKGFVHIFLLILICSIGAATYFILSNRKPIEIKSLSTIVNPSPTPFEYQFPYKSPSIPKNPSYRMIIVGDSIVGSLGANANVLRLQLKKLYPDSEFVTYNYGYPATSVLSLPDRLTKQTISGASEYPPILAQGFELIIIESFSNNPMSEFPLEEGLKKQTETLEQSVSLILQQKPTAALAFMTPIGFSFKNYGRGNYELSPEVRKSWINERIAYLENHKKFAAEKGIPVIDVYSSSLKPDGQVDESYIADDFVHPSVKGIELISQTIADYIFKNKIFPQ